MTIQEPRVIWPELDSPVIVIRDITIMHSSVGSSKKRKPTLIQDIELEVLVNNALYVARQEAQGIRKGQILSRNMKLTKDLKRDTSIVSQHVFQRFDSINDVRRAYSRINPKYNLVTIPSMRDWIIQSDYLQKAFWVLSEANSFENSDYVWAPYQLDLELEDQARLKQKSALRKRGMSPPSSWRSREFVSKMHHLRGVGRRMQWRAVVLETYLDQLHSKCREIRTYSKNKLDSSELFGTDRTTRRALKHAADIHRLSKALKAIHVRPFSRALNNVSLDLEEVAGFIKQAVKKLDPTFMDGANTTLRRVYRSIVLLEQHWLLEEILLIIAWYKHTKQSVPQANKILISNQLEEIFHLLTKEDLFTGECLEKGFRNKMLEVVIRHLQLARCEFHNDEINTNEIYKHVKAACSLF